MSNYHSLKSELKEAILPTYGEREADLIAKYYFQDKSLLDPSKKYSSQETEQIRADISRLSNAEPLQYVTGISHFYGYKYKVNKHVLIPRPETEELVQIALKAINNNSQIKSILDIGTGSGCILNTIALKSRGPLNYIGLDISAEALAVARLNAKSFNLEINYRQMDFLDESQWPETQVPDLIISNPPYISTNESKEMRSNVLDYEPHIALFSHEDPLIFYKKIAKYSVHQKHCPLIVCEINEHLGPETVEIFSSIEDTETTIINDMQGKNRIIKVIPNRFSL